MDLSPYIYHKVYARRAYFTGLQVGVQLFLEMLDRRRTPYYIAYIGNDRLMVSYGA